MPQEAEQKHIVRAAALVAGDGSTLQAILDSLYFHELPNLELVSVICPQKGAYAGYEKRRYYRDYNYEYSSKSKTGN